MLKASLLAAVLMCSFASISAQARQTQQVGCPAGESSVGSRAEGGNFTACIPAVKATTKVDFVCPEDSIAYVNAEEGGPGFACECPQEKIITTTDFVDHTTTLKCQK